MDREYAHHQDFAKEPQDQPKTTITTMMRLSQEGKDFAKVLSDQPRTSITTMMRVSLATDVPLHLLIPTMPTEITFAMDREPARQRDGAKESPDQPRTLITTTMRVPPETDAPPLLTPTMPTETTTVMETEPAHQRHGAKEYPDDLSKLLVYFVLSFNVILHHIVLEHNQLLL